jgi:uncharacterized protein (DUF58 family)
MTYDRQLFRTFNRVYRLDRWFKQRFTPLGMLLVGTLVLAGVFGINTRANLAYQLMSLTAALVLVAMAWAPWFRARLEVERRMPRYATAGEPLCYRVHVTNRSSRLLRGLYLLEEVHAQPLTPERFRGEHAGEPGARPWLGRFIGYAGWAMATRWREGAQPRPVPLPDLPPGRTVEVEVTWRPRRRGYVRLRGAAILRPDPLGIFHGIVRVSRPDSVIVMPRRYPVNWIAWTGRLHDRPGGLSQAASTSGVEEFAALREYRAGDPLRHIDWKGWARLGMPIVKEYFETCFVRQALILDTSLAAGTGRAQFEAAVSVAASFLAAGPAAMRGALDLIFVGTEVHRVSAGIGVGTMDGVLEALACAEPQAEQPFAVLHQAVRQRAGELSACVCVLLEWDAPRQELVHMLRSQGVPLLVLLVAAPGSRGRPDPGPMADQPDRFRVLSADALESHLAGLSHGPAASAPPPATGARAA